LDIKDIVEDAVALAPMAGVTDSAFRSICMEHHASYTVSEMISAKALSMGDKKTKSLLKKRSVEKPFGIQLFGHSPDDFKSASEILEDDYSPDFVDINMGCPAPKIISSGAGCALMDDVVLSTKIVEAVKKSISVPVTAKIRCGFKDKKNAPEFARALEQSGIDAVTIHARTSNMKYKPPIDLFTIEKLCNAVRVPVIGNGDICTVNHIKIMNNLGCSGVMIGRAAMGNPFIFLELSSNKRGVPFNAPTSKEKFDVLLKQVERAIEDKGERNALNQSRKHVCWYLKGMRGASKLRNDASKISSYIELKNLIIKALELERAG